MRLIDAVVAQNIADNELYVDDAGIVQFVLSHTPTIDAVPVVRCSKCRHSFELCSSPLKKEPPYKYYRDDCWMCAHEDLAGDYLIPVTAMFFCGYGEPKDGE